MRNLKKCLFTLSFAFIMVMALGVVNVNAREYDLSNPTDLQEFTSGNDITLTSEDSLSYNGEVWFGAAGRITPTTGTITVKYDSTRTDLDPNGVVDITFSDGIVLLNSGKQFIAQIDMSALMPDMKVPVNLTITDDCGFHIYGRLAIPSGENSTIINNGTILVLEGGTLEIRDRADNYQGYGVLNIFGELAIYGTSGSNIGSQKINLEYGGSVYSEANVFDNIVKAPFDTSYFTYSLVEKTDKYYESVTPAPAVGGKTFPYAWTVEMTQVTDIPVTDPTDNPTTEEETTTENVENPETSDGLLLFLGLTVVGFAGVALTYKRLHN